MLERRDLATVDAHGSDADACTEHLGAHDETDEDQDDSEQLAEEERPHQNG
jgi:hypothetical protein